MNNEELEKEIRKIKDKIIAYIYLTHTPLVYDVILFDFKLRLWYKYKKYDTKI